MLDRVVDTGPEEECWDWVRAGGRQGCVTDGTLHTTLHHPRPAMRVGTRVRDMVRVRVRVRVAIRVRDRVGVLIRVRVRVRVRVRLELGLGLGLGLRLELGLQCELVFGLQLGLSLHSCAFIIAAINTVPSRTQHMTSQH